MKYQLLEKRKRNYTTQLASAFGNVTLLRVVVVGIVCSFVVGGVW
jgi:hypothetical protein